MDASTNVFAVKLVEGDKRSPDYAYFHEFTVLAADGEEAVAKAKSKAMTEYGPEWTVAHNELKLVAVEHITDIDIP